MTPNVKGWGVAENQPILENDTQKYFCTGVILAGGQSKRFSGRDKSFLKIGQTRIIDRTYAIFQELFEEIILVTNQPLQYLDWDVNIVTDIIPKRSALTGIHTGLFYATYSHAFFCACDLPFLKKEVITHLLSRLGRMDPKPDVMLPETPAGLEPMCAVYSKRMLHSIEHQLLRDNFRIQDAFGKHRILHIKASALNEIDPEFLSFFNINTPEDLRKAEEIANKRG